MELQKLQKWLALKMLAHDELKKSCKAFKHAHNKRKVKHEEVRDNVEKELNSQFSRWELSTPICEVCFYIT